MRGGGGVAVEEPRMCDAVMGLTTAARCLSGSMTWDAVE